MVKEDSVVAIVPARGGSKSIPRKNIRPLGGIPLIGYSVTAGLAAKSVGRVIVSTDDEEIAAVARRFGADVPFIRPSSLAEDTTTDFPVFEHAVQWLADHEGWLPEIVVQLRPTSPLRPPDCVDAAVRILRASPTADSVRGITPAAQNPYKMWSLSSDGGLAPLLNSNLPEGFNQPRQKLPATYWQTGHVDAVRTATILEKRSMSGDRIEGLLIDPAYAIDIDTDADWRRAEWTIAHFDRPLVRPSERDPRFPDTVRLIVFDFDGVLTDNRVWVSASGEEWVAGNRSDGLGLDTLRGLGIQLFVLSKEANPVVAARCQKLGLEHEHGVMEKAPRLRRLLAERGISAAETVFVGNDINDLDCMQLAACGVAVADAHPAVLAAADLVLTRAGGHGAVRELCDRLAAHVGRDRAPA